MRPSFLALNPSSTYTLIRSWCKSTPKMFLIWFLFIFILENSKMSGTFGEHYPFYHVVLWCSFFFLFPAWVAWRRGHHYWIIFRHEATWPLKRLFIRLEPLLNIPKDHCASPQLCLFIPSKQYPHCGPYNRNYPYLWPPFNLINLSWA